MPVVTKESLLRQTAECRRRIESLLEFKNEAFSTFDEAFKQFTRQLSEAENVADKGDDKDVNSTLGKLKSSMRMLEEYRERMEAVRVLLENDQQLEQSLVRIDKLFTEQTAEGESCGHDTIHGLSANHASDVRSDAESNDLIAFEDTVSSPNEQTEIAAAGETLALENVVASSSPPDFRKHVVSKGNGNVDDFCQRSIDLMASRIHPLKCRLTHAESPSFFWIQLDDNIVDSIEEGLNEAVEEDGRPLIDPHVGDYCIAAAEGDGDLLHRAKILDIKKNKFGILFSKVLYIDTGKIDWVAVQSLFEMPRRFHCFARQACPCILAEVEPTSGFWTRDVIAAFRELCAIDDGASYLVVKALDQGESPDINTVSLYRVNNNTLQKRSVLIQLIGCKLDKLHRAEVMVPMVGFRTEDTESVGGLNPPDVADGWRCVVRPLECKAPPAEAAAAIASASVKRADEQERSGCYRPNPPRIKVAQGSVERISLPDVVVSNNNECFYFCVRNPISPGQFNVQLRNVRGRNDELDQLTNDLNVFYSESANRVMLGKAVPQYAVVRRMMDGNDAYRRIYIENWKIRSDTRFVSRDFRANGTVSALYVDYGCRENLQARDIFILERRFCALPAQSINCKLHECKSLSPFGVWNKNDIDFFQKLCVSKNTLMKGVLMSEVEPYEIVAYRLDDNGTETCINGEMVKANLAISDTTWT